MLVVRAFLSLSLFPRFAYLYSFHSCILHYTIFIPVFSYSTQVRRHADAFKQHFENLLFPRRKPSLIFEYIMQMNVWSVPIIVWKLEALYNSFYSLITSKMYVNRMNGWPLKLIWLYHVSRNRSIVNQVPICYAPMRCFVCWHSKCIFTASRKMNWLLKANRISFTIILRYENVDHSLFDSFVLGLIGSNKSGAGRVCKHPTSINPWS